MKNAKVAIIGGGFSGLTLAWCLLKLQVPVVVYEARNEVGGMLQTKRNPLISEAAANAIISSLYVEEMFKDLDIKWIRAGNKSKNRWILSRGQINRWPLTWIETIKCGYRLIKNILLKKHSPFANETVRQWSQRIFKNDAVDLYLLGPALQGIYATTTDQLSAELILGPLFQKSVAKVQYRGSISPIDGMQTIGEKLSEWVIAHGGEIVKNYPIDDINQVSQDYDSVVVATSLNNAQLLLKKSAEIFSEELAQIPTQGLTNIGFGFTSERPLKGFGCLFSSTEQLSSLGVLFNSDIFENRGTLENETWITRDTENSDSQIIRNILNDRKKVFQLEQEPTFVNINKWPKAIPVYGLSLLKFLKKYSDQHEVQKDHDSSIYSAQVLNKGLRVSEIQNKAVYLTGNYLGGIGLAKILTYNVDLAQKIKKEIG